MNLNKNSWYYELASWGSIDYIEPHNLRRLVLDIMYSLWVIFWTIVVSFFLVYFLFVEPLMYFWVSFKYAFFDISLSCMPLSIALWVIVILGGGAILFEELSSIKLNWD